jgi:methionyl-tRNA formyltransferase
MNDQAVPARLVMVTGHTFGVRAFEGIFSSPAFLAGQLEVPLIIGLDEAKAGGTVGYQSPGPLAADQGADFVATADGRLRSLAARIRAARPAYLLVIGWSALIPDDVLAIPQEVAGDAAGPGGCGCIGMHPTRLPDGRGQAPIPWTIIKGGRQTALSVFFLEPAADTGPVIAQYDLAVSPRETAASLFYRMAQAHFTAGAELAGRLAQRRVPAEIQDAGAATRWPKRRPRDGEIRPEATCAEIDALVRGLLGPYPRAFAVLDGQPVQVVAAGGSGAPGDIPFACRDGVCYLRPAPGARTDFPAGLVQAGRPDAS